MKKTKLSLAAILLLTLILSACSGNKNDEQGSQSASSSQPASSTQAASSAPSSDPAAEDAAEDPFGKYDPPIEITSVRVVNSSYTYVDGEDISNNVWTRAYESELGIKLKYDWVVNSDQGAQKMNLTIASGTIPEFMTVDATQLNQLAEADLIMDLTEV